MRAREQWRARFLSTRGAPDKALDGLRDFFGFADADRRAVLELSLEGQRVRLTATRKNQQRRRSHIEQPLVGTAMTVFFEGEGPASERSFDIVRDGPHVELRLERERDVAPRARGLVREVQTGFAEFDDAVFIEDHASEEDVLRVLSKPATRAAVLDLLGVGVETVTLTRHAAQIFLPTEDPAQLDDQRILDALELLLVVGRAGGLRADAPVRRGDIAIPVFATVAAAMFAYAFVVWSVWPTGLTPLAFGLTLGAVFPVAARPLAEKMTAGDGASAGRSLALLLTWGLGACMALTGALIHLNGALDHTEPEVFRGVVSDLRITQRRKNSEHTMAVIRWGDGSTESMNASELNGRGDKVTQKRHPGALGIGWREQAVFDYQ